jgi:uncharacterized protein (DUF305 family)
MKITWIVAAAAGALALAGGIAFAQMGPGMQPDGSHHEMMRMHMAQGMMHGQGQGGMGNMHGGMQGTGSKGDQGPSSLAFQGVNAKMHANMDIAFTGNADVDFVKGMIPHHQGAIDMAKVVLAFGKDPEVKKLAEGIIKAQEEEIAWMNTWLQKNGK